MLGEIFLLRNGSFNGNVEIPVRQSLMGKLCVEFPSLEGYFHMFVRGEGIDYDGFVEAMIEARRQNFKDHYIILAMVKAGIFIDFNSTGFDDKAVSYKLYCHDGYSQQPVLYFSGKEICIGRKKNALGFAKAYEKIHKQVFVYKIFRKGKKAFWKKVGWKPDESEALKKSRSSLRNFWVHRLSLEKVAPFGVKTQPFLFYFAGKFGI